MKQKRSAKETAFARAQGRKIYELRTERGLTRRDLSDSTGINETHIFRVEMGDAMASAYQIDAMARALDASWESLFPKACQIVTITRTFSFGTAERRAFA